MFLILFFDVLAVEFFGFFKKFGRLSFTEKLWAGGVFFGTYLFYLLTLYPTVATEDAGEFSTAVATLGISHPPGYPLYILLGKVFTVLIPFGNMAWKVNLFSAFCGAAAAAVLFLCLKLFTKNDVLSALGAGIFAMGSVFWSQAVRAEVYTLNTLLFVLILFLLLLWHEKRHDFSAEESKRALLLSAFLYGLSLCNHQLMFLAGPPFLLFVLLAEPKFMKDWKFLLKAFVVFLGGLALYLYLPIRASMHPTLNWGDPSTWENFWNQVTRKLYSAGAVDPSMNLQAGAPQETPQLFSVWWFDDTFHYHFFQTVLYAAQHFIEDYFWGLLLFVPFGFTWLWKKAKAYFWLFVGLFVFYSLVLSEILHIGYVDKLPVDLFKDRPFFIPILAILFFLSVLGVHDVSQKFLKHAVQKLVALFLAGVLIFVIVVHFPVENQSQNYITYDIAKLALTMLPANSVYFIQNGDNTLFPVFYLNKVEGLRNDVKFYIPSPINIYNFFTSLDDLESQNPGKRIFTDFPFTDYLNKTYDYLGPISEIVDQENLARQQQMGDLLQTVKIRGFDSTYLDHFNSYLHGRFFLDLGLIFGGIDDAKQKTFFEKSLEVAPDSLNVFSQLIGNYYVRRNLFAEAIPFLQKALKFLPNDYAINFQLFLSSVVTGDTQDAVTYFSTLIRTDKILFQREYPQVKAMFPQNEQQFLNFEQAAQQ